MILAYHVCASTYGFWLPNDPRGSGSNYVGSKRLLKHGRATGLADRSRPVSAQKHDWILRLEAKQSLKYPPVIFNGIQARAVGRGFEQLIQQDGLIVWACSILPGHFHMVLARHDRPIEKTVERLKGAATRRLIQESVHPFGGVRLPNGRPPKCWGRGLWTTFLDSPEAILRAIAYVEANPVKEGKRPQRWPFVVSYLP